MVASGEADFEALIGRSSLGTAGARMLRDRVTRGRAIRARELAARMRVLVTGGDGYCGWPTALYLSDQGHDVTILDDLSRRKADVDLGTGSLTPIRPIGERLRAWQEVSGREIGFIHLDLAAEYDRLAGVLRDLRPDVVVHFAAQRAAPYSMSSPGAKRYTVDNNVRGTHNLLAALAATGGDPALVHLGSMGVYGYEWPASAPIPEGYLTVKVPTPDGDLEREILHPADPGSVYHMTKTLDQLMFAFYAKNDGLRITDLHQGIVWGTQTDQTIRDERLINRFDYDGDYGTVLNRFLMQAAIGHPLTVYGQGGQTRAFIHIRDTVRCIEIAITNPPQPGSQVMVFNQVTETYRIADLAKMVADITGVRIANLPNPRREADENDLAVRNDRFLALGLQPTKLSDRLLDEIVAIARQYRDRADISKIIWRSVWWAGMETAEDLSQDIRPAWRPAFSAAPGESPPEDTSQPSAGPPSRDPDTGADHPGIAATGAAQGQATARSQRPELTAADQLRNAAELGAPVPGRRPGDPEAAGYPPAVASAAAGITPRQLDYWARTGLLEPGVQAGAGTRRLYSFHDIVVLRVIKRLLDTGVSLQQIRAAVRYLREHGADDLATLTLMSDGTSVYACTAPDEIADLLSGGQGLFGVAVGRVWQEVQASLAERAAEAVSARIPGAMTEQAAQGGAA